ncbi:MAG: DUF1850 domain-containing protein [Rhodocyclales bacterium]|nr:DUF1850 domain-containing protein [Rhodocyclales bacterium]
MSALCLAAGALLVSMPMAAGTFTLAWTHSIEKVRWEEDWRIVGGRLQVDAARIRGSGAGMEVPAGAVLKDGAWHYRPPLPPLERVSLAHSPYAAGYELCADGQCRRLADLLPGIGDNAVIEMTACASR